MWVKPVLVGQFEFVEWTPDNSETASDEVSVRHWDAKSRFRKAILARDLVRYSAVKPDAGNHQRGSTREHRRGVCCDASAMEDVQYCVR
jgi:hypothetical protein